DRQALGLGTLLGGAVVVVQAVLDREPLERVAGVPYDVSVGVEVGPAAAAAVPVALVGRGEVAFADPLDRVVLTRHVRQRVGQRDRAVLRGVDALEVDRSGAERLGDLAGLGVDEDDAVVLLQGHRERALAVDADVLGLGVGGR